MVCLKAQRQNMGSTPQGTGEDPSIIDTDAIIAYTRSPKKQPEYVPRSRSLEDLPGGLRVPIIKRPESRVQPRLHAVKAGIEELEALRKQHEKLIDDAKTIKPSITKGSSYDQQKKIYSGHEERRFSASTLSSIKEEETHKRGMASEEEDTLYQVRNVRSFSTSDANVLSNNNVLRKTLPKTDNTSTESKDNNVSSEEGEIDQSRPIKPRSKSFRDIRVQNSSTLSPSRNASVREISRNWSQTTLIEEESSSPPPPGALKSRRPSYFSESIITHDTHREAIAKVASERIMQCSFPSPLHAVLRQYQGSYKHILSQQKQVPDTLKSSDGNKSSGVSDINEKLDLVNSPTCVEKPNGREESFTSDYFGSVETIHSILSLPANLVTSPKHNDIRRFSLPLISEIKSVRETDIEQLKERCRQQSSSKQNNKNETNTDKFESHDSLSEIENTHNKNESVPNDETSDEIITDSCMKKDEGYASFTKDNLSISSIEYDVSTSKGDTKTALSDTEDDVFETVQNKTPYQKAQISKINEKKTVKKTSPTKLLETDL